MPEWGGVLDENPYSDRMRIIPRGSSEERALERADYFIFEREGGQEKMEICRNDVLAHVLNAL